MKSELDLLRELAHLTAASFRDAMGAPSEPAPQAGPAATKPAPVRKSRSSHLDSVLERLEKIRQAQPSTGPKVIRTRHD